MPDENYLRPGPWPPRGPYVLISDYDQDLAGAVTWYRELRPVERKLLTETITERLILYSPAKAAASATAFGIRAMAKLAALALAHLEICLNEQERENSQNGVIDEPGTCDNRDC